MHKKTEGKFNRIYVNMASVSVYRSYAKCVLRTKTLIFPNQDNGWLSVPATELCNYQQQQQQQQNFINKHINHKLTEVLPAANKAIRGGTMRAKYKNRD